MMTVEQHADVATQFMKSTRHSHRSSSSIAGAKTLNNSQEGRAASCVDLVSAMSAGKSVSLIDARPSNCRVVVVNDCNASPPL